MKLITLNTWGGRAGKNGLLDFFARHKDVDIFCLQEIWHHGEDMVGKIAGGVPMVNIVPSLLEPIERTLSGYSSYFRPHFRDIYGLAMFVRNGIDVKGEGEIFVYKEKGFVSKIDIGDHARNLQYMQLGPAGALRTVVNFHGAWIPETKKADTSDRLSQSDNIIRFLKTVRDPYVLCGDFNLLPETESLKKIERSGLRNLISEFGITSTRTSHYKKPVKFADYVFVSKNIKVDDFKVLPDEVSDHAPLYLDFE